LRLKILSILFCCVSFFIYEAVISLRKVLHLDARFKQAFQHLEKSSFLDISYLERIACQKYPISSLHSSISIAVVPCCEHEQAQYLVAAVYRNLKRDDIDHIILITQSDNEMFHGVGLPTAVASTKLLSNCIIDTLSLKKLAYHPLFHYYDPAYYCASALHDQMHYIQYYFNQTIKITPLILGHMTHENAREVAEHIALICDDRSLIIFALNINSCQESTNQSTCYQTLYNADASVIQAIQGFPTGSKEVSMDSLHGKYGYIVLLNILEQQQFKNMRSTFVGYDASPDNLHGHHIKSYAAFIYERREQGGYINNIGSYEQQQLVSIAQDALYVLFEPYIIKKQYMMSYEMMQPHGAFVSLYAMSDHGTLLRGCMGLMFPEASLSEVVADMAQQAATMDQRFYALKHQELKSTMISISLISDVQNVLCMDRIKESDGILFEYGNKSAISLPSKNFLDNWNYQDALTDLCFQAQVPSLSWRESQAKICTFQALVFQ